MDVLHPTPSLLVKLGSIARHVEEFLAPGGHHLDKVTLDGLIEDPEVREWMEAADKMALLPVMRDAD